jgi:hypothetical protein
LNSAILSQRKPNDSQKNSRRKVSNHDEKKRQFKVAAAICVVINLDKSVYFRVEEKKADTILAQLLLSKKKCQGVSRCRCSYLSSVSSFGW